MVPDARAWSGVRLVVACLCASAVLVQLADIAARALPISNFLSYFTIQSNVFAAVVLAVTAGRALRGREIESLRLWRGAATLYLTVTGVVYLLLLRDVDVQTSEPWINAVLHYVSPVVVLVDWLLFPPDRRISRREVLWWLAYPVAYLAYSLLRGLAVDWYPYPFLDPSQGYVQVAVTAVVMLLSAAGVGLALAGIAARHGGRRGARRSAVSTSGTRRSDD